MRKATVDPSQVAVVENGRIDHPGAVFELKSGRLALLTPVNGKPAGAVFQGDGVFAFTPPNALEKQQMQRYARGKEVLVEPFTKAAFYFTEDTLKQLRAQMKPQAVPDVKNETSVLEQARDVAREQVRTNLEAELLRSIESGQTAFMAIIFGRNSRTLLYSMLPNDVEQVGLLHVTSTKHLEIWGSWTVPGTEKESRDLFDATMATVETTVAKNANLSGKAAIQFTSLKSGHRLVPLRLAGPLRVSSVEDAAGAKLSFIQEAEKRDSDLWVIAPEKLEAGKHYDWTLTYAGKDVIHKAGSGNFFVGARESWFPRPVNGGENFSDRLNLKLKFQSPKDNTLVATGKLVSRKKEGDVEITEWDSEGPTTVGGFNYGNFTSKTAKNENVEVTVYANRSEPDEIAELKHLVESNPQAATALGITSGGLSTTGMAQSAANEAANCMAFYTWAFGSLPIKQVAVTQQPSSVFGQSWPGLIFLPYTAFFDSTTRNQLQFGKGTKNFLEEVGPHEVAHQWWGHEVMWKSYRDQWLSEGFAEYSAAMYLERVQGFKRMDQFMEDLRQEITVPGTLKYRPNDYGPITMGYRLNSEDTPGVSRLIYSKGAYVLHMLRMMLHDNAKSDDTRFLNMMRDFIAANRGKAVGTEDFLAIVSKHSGRDMRWFFDQWVYGTAIPKIDVEYKIVQAEGKTRIDFSGKINGTPPGFIVVLPVRMIFKQSTVTGRLLFTTETKGGQIDLPEVPTNVEFNPYHSVLCETNVRKL